MRSFGENVLEEMMSSGIHRLQRENRKVSNKHVLALYRQVLKFANEFSWVDQSNNLWSDKIKKSARSEIEIARDEKDPFVISQMIITSKEAISILREKLIVKYHKTSKDILDHSFHSESSHDRKFEFDSIGQRD